MKCSENTHEFGYCKKINFLSFRSKNKLSSFHHTESQFCNLPDVIKGNYRFANKVQSFVWTLHTQTILQEPMSKQLPPLIITFKLNDISSNNQEPKIINHKSQKNLHQL